MSFSLLINPQPKRHKIVGRVVLLMDMTSRDPETRARRRKAETPEQRERRIQRQREWYAENSAYHREKVRARSKARKQKIAEHKRAYYAANRERELERSRRYYAEHREEIIAKQAARDRAKRQQKESA